MSCDVGMKRSGRRKYPEFSGMADDTWLMGKKEEREKKIRKQNVQMPGMRVGES
jgi:hypothetical protein